MLFRSYVIDRKERILRPELAGGALLDLGVYLLNFAAMCFGKEVASVHSAKMAQQVSCPYDLPVLS